jgi:hypothetical protein
VPRGWAIAAVRQAGEIGPYLVRADDEGFKPRGFVPDDAPNNSENKQSQRRQTEYFVPE